MPASFVFGKAAPMATEDVDLIVIGSGQGGNPLARDFARDGKKVVLFERDKIGGTCVNWGCTPSKTFLASAHGAGRARQAAAIGVHATLTIDDAAIMKRVRQIKGAWSASSEKTLRDAGVRIVAADARFTGVRTVEGGGVSVRAPSVVIDTGTRATVPNVPGLEGSPYLTNHSFFNMERLPKSLIVMGAGYTGLELGQGSARLGVEVQIIDMHRVMAHEEPEASAVVQKALEADGVQFHLDSTVSSVRYDGGFTVSLENRTELTADALLVCIGRTPNTDTLNASVSGIELTEEGFVRVDEHLRATCEGVYALGDVAGQPQFTHVAWEDYRRIKDVMNGGTRTRNDRPLAYSSFTEPQLGRVGLTHAQALQQGYDAAAVQTNLSDDARGVEWNLTDGFFRIVVDQKSKKFLGATFVGYEAGELIHIIYAHIMNDATWHVLEQSVHIHPTFAEALPTTVRKLVTEEKSKRVAFYNERALQSPGKGEGA